VVIFMHLRNDRAATGSDSDSLSLDLRIPFALGTPCSTQISCSEATSPGVPLVGHGGLRCAAIHQAKSGLRGADLQLHVPNATFRSNWGISSRQWLTVRVFAMIR
jgi:hypothetical protein